MRFIFSGSALVFKICRIFDVEKNESSVDFPYELKRKTDYLTHDVFNSYHSETEMLRYINN